MKHCDTCLTNVGELCPSCRNCTSCCEENKCFGCDIIIPTLREILPKKVVDKIEADIIKENSQ